MSKLNSKTKSAIGVFNKWAKTGKDEGMKKNHFPAFQEAKKIIKKHCKNKNKPTLADIGCGNGWATYDLNQEELIDKAIGYDGSLAMVQKAKQTYLSTEFFRMNLNN